MDSSARIAEVKEKVQRYLLEVLNRVEVDRDGDFTFRQGSARMFISVASLGETSTAVRIVAPIINDAPASPELFRYIATDGSYRFGHLTCEEKDGKLSILFVHSLLGDFLDPDELKLAVFLMARTADELDDQIKTKFGGRTFHED
jgi:hypothetical protein